MKDKKLSRRQTLKKKYAIAKKVSEHKKKVRKLVKKTAVHHRSRKDPGIPNNWPFKTELLKEIQQKKADAALERHQRRQEIKQRAREARANQAKGSGTMEVEMQEDATGVPQLTDEEYGAHANLRHQVALCVISAYAAMVARATEAASQFVDTDAAQADEMKGVRGGAMGSTAGFVRMLRQVIDKADVLIEVLDARDPNACRHLEVEREIVALGKKVILLLNKIDLVPKDVVEKWVHYLRKSFPTEVFKSATSKASRPIAYAKSPYGTLSEAELHSGCLAVGAPALLNLLKNYSRTGSASGTKTSMTVGVIGIPNVGKSSVINSLCRNTRAARVGGEPGVTRGIQEIALDNKIKLLDSPGVVMGRSDTDLNVILQNAVKISTVKDRIEVVDAFVKKYAPSQLMQLFKVPFFTSTSEFLGHVARARGKLCKGGGYDFAAAAEVVLHEWSSGKIQHFCLPPADENLNDNNELASGTRILTRFSEPFRIDDA